MKTREAALRLAAEQSRLRAQQHRVEAALAAQEGAPPVPMPSPLSHPDPPPRPSSPDEEPIFGGLRPSLETEAKVVRPPRGRPIQSRSPSPRRPEPYRTERTASNKRMEKTKVAKPAAKPAFNRTASGGKRATMQNIGLARKRTATPTTPRRVGKKPGLPAAARGVLVQADDPHDENILKRLDLMEKSNDMLRDQMNIKATSAEEARLGRLEEDNYVLREQISVLLKCHPLVAKALSRPPRTPSPQRDSSPPPADYLSPQHEPPPDHITPNHNHSLLSLGTPPPQIGMSGGGVVSAAFAARLIQDAETDSRRLLESAAAQTLKGVLSCASGVLMNFKKMDTAANEAEQSLKNLERALASSVIYEGAHKQQQQQQPHHDPYPHAMQTGSQYAPVYDAQGQRIGGRGVPIRTEALSSPVSPAPQRSVPQKEQEERKKKKRVKGGGGGGGGGGDERTALLHRMHATEQAERTAGAQNAVLRAELDRIRSEQQQKRQGGGGGGGGGMGGGERSGQSLPQSLPQQPRSPMPFDGYVVSF